VQAAGLEGQRFAGRQYQRTGLAHAADAVDLLGAMDHRHAEVAAFHVHHFHRLPTGIAQHQVTGQRGGAGRRGAHPGLFDHRLAVRGNGG
jgi:hypothetical protein